MRKLILVYFCSIAFICVFNVKAENEGGTQFSVFHTKPDARMQGLGGVSVPLERHLFAVSENPALSATLRGPCLATSQAKMFLDENLYSVALGYGSIFSKYYWGCSAEWIQLASYDIEKTLIVKTSDGRDSIDDHGDLVYGTGTYSDISNALLLSVGMALSPWLHIGISAKGLSSSIDDSTLWGAGADAGLYSSLNKSTIRIGVALKDAVPAVLFSDTGRIQENERMLAAGVSLALFDRRFIISGQLENRLNSTFDKTGSAGIEWQIAKPVAIRAGWNNEYYSAGASIMLGGLHLHYAVINHNDFGYDNPHRISIIYYFGGTELL